jgi:peptide/nickel transport system substrate-binding protein
MLKLRLDRPGPLALAVIGALLAACTSAPTDKNNYRTGGKITVASWQEQDSLLAGNIIAASSHALAYVNPAMEGLLTVRASADVPKDPKIWDYWVAELATEVPTEENGAVKVSGNKMTVTWKLRNNAKWHDGVPFTSRDVKATFDFWWLKFKDKNPTPLVSTSGWDQVESVELPDDYTAVVHFKTVFAPYLTLGTGPYGILPEHILQQVWGKSGNLTTERVNVNIPGAFSGTNTLDKLMVGTGPYMFKEWMTGDHLTLVRNPHWWGPHKPYLDEIKVKFVPDAQSELTDLRTGAIDLGLDMRAGLLPALSRLPQISTAVIPGSSAEHIDIQMHNTFLQDINLRRAILMGIDRQRIVDTLLLGKTTVPPDAWMCIGTGAWCLDPNARHTPYNPEAAKKLLDDAGYKVQTEGPCKNFRTDPRNRCVQLRLISTTLALREAQEVYIASDLAAINLEVLKPFNNVTSTRLFGSCKNGGIIYSHIFDMAMYTNNYASPAEPDSLAYSAYHSSQIPQADTDCVGQNSTFMSNPKLDKALDQARLSVRQADRKAQYILAQQALAADLPEIPLYQGIDVEAFNKRLLGYKGNEFWWMNNSADWYLGA